MEIRGLEWHACKLTREDPWSDEAPQSARQSWPCFDTDFESHPSLPYVHPRHPSHEPWTWRALQLDAWPLHHHQCQRCQVGVQRGRESKRKRRCLCGSSNMSSHQNLNQKPRPAYLLATSLKRIGSHRSDASPPSTWGPTARSGRARQNL